MDETAFPEHYMMTKTVYMVCTSCKDEMQRAMREIERLEAEAVNLRRLCFKAADFVNIPMQASDAAGLREELALAADGDAVEPECSQIDMDPKRCQSMTRIGKEWVQCHKPLNHPGPVCEFK